MELLGQNKVDHRQRKVAIISQDSFYKVLTPDQKAKALKGQYNFDHPGRTWLQSALSGFLTAAHTSLHLVKGQTPDTPGKNMKSATKIMLD